MYDELIDSWCGQCEFYIPCRCDDAVGVCMYGITDIPSSSDRSMAKIIADDYIVGDDEYACEVFKYYEE